MIIIKIQGRLGNQMFQYALYNKLKCLGNEVKLDFSQLYINGLENELTLFNIDYEIANSDDISKLGDCNKFLLYKVKRKIFGRKKSHYFEKNLNYNPEILDMDNVYLEGFWQSELYFKNIRNKILESFEFPTISFYDQNSQTLKQIEHTESVSIHVRRGDYLHSKFSGIYGDICTEDYYSNAIQYILNCYDNAMFFVFSDDPEWAKRTFVGNNYYFVEGNNGKDSYKDMYLMSRCKHNIIANSSFSWWGAWLNECENKIVISPKKWINNFALYDIYCENWIKI